MEGIKEAIAYITGLAVKAEDPKTVEINGKTYCTKDLVRYDAPEKAAPISATTLTSLVDYIKENREELRDRMIIQVVNETKVLLYSGLLAERDRETLFEVNALLPRFEYGREYDQEGIIHMRGLWRPLYAGGIRRVQGPTKQACFCHKRKRRRRHTIHRPTFKGEDCHRRQADRQVLALHSGSRRWKK